MSTGSFSRGIKRLGRGVNHPQPDSSKDLPERRHLLFAHPVRAERSVPLSYKSQTKDYHIGEPHRIVSRDRLKLEGTEAKKRAWWPLSLFVYFD